MSLNNKKILNTNALAKAFLAYNDMITYAGKVESKLPEELEHYELHSAKASLIQHFEFSYELCWKFMKRYLESEGVSFSYSRKELFREAIQAGLIKDFELWTGFNEARNRTTHTYDKSASDEIYKTAKVFFHEFKAFIQALEDRL
jgi:nucleotidyltransferase substrate binding protein (TIGR01987 family)